MKKYLFIAASALALASCSSEDFVGTEGGNVENGATKAINFAGETGKTTRAANGNKVGAKAAELLGKKFYVLGTKGILPTNSPTTTKVFDNYQVGWEANTAGTSSDNTNDWKYAGLDFVGLNTSHTGNQTIKYWDYSQPQYDFIAYSIGDNKLVTDNKVTLTENEVYGSTIVTPNADATNNTYASYTLKTTKIDDLKECYYTDVTTVEKTNYSKPVQFTFKNLTAKVRVAFYETVPGYSVKDLQFYSDENTSRADLNTEDSKKATLYTTGTEDFVAKNGEITVTYPVVGATAKNANTTGYNKAFVSVDPNGTDKDTKLALGSVNYAKDNKLAISAKTASMAGQSDDGYYTAVLPTATKGKPLTLRMNYTLVSDDGSEETIKVYGAKAVIPASYTQWQPNYAYTYIFKISDNTNGFTSTDNNTQGLFPITFDAVVADIDNVDFNQETITTVSTPSVTTYAFDTKNNVVIKAYNTGEEYPATDKTDIYFSVAEDGTEKKDLDKNGQLYSIDEAHKTATEAEVIDALQVIGSTNGSVTTGRNGVKLTKLVTENPSTIPTEDGKTILVEPNTVAKFTANATPTTYAYVYTKETGNPTYILSAVIIKEGETITTSKDEYYTNPSGEDKYVVKEGTTLTPGIYYKKYTNNNNVYGVKVVKTYQKN